MNRFAGQVALVTGAASGLGLGIAQRLSREGAAVALLDRDGTRLRQAAGLIGGAGAAATVVCDVVDADAVGNAVSDLAAKVRRIDVLVNAAGVNGNTTALTHELPPADFERVMAVNVHGPFHCIRAVLPVMLAAGYGRIVNLTSIAGKAGNPRMLAYSASKAALIGLTQVVGKEYAERGILCNAVAPALVRTPATESVHSPERFAELARTIPMGRTGEIEEVAAVAAFAASRECSFTTGFTFDASGGRAVY